MAAARAKQTVEPLEQTRGDATGLIVGAFDAERHLSGLLDLVQRGKTITITRRGVPVAVLAPPDALQPVSGAQDGEEWLEQAIAAWQGYRVERQRRGTNRPAPDCVRPKPC